MKHAQERKRIMLAAELGVAPDDVDYNALVNPALRAARIAGHISQNCDTDETEDELYDYYFAVETPAEIAAYEHIMEVMYKYGGF